MKVPPLIENVILLAILPLAACAPSSSSSAAPPAPNEGGLEVGDFNFVDSHQAGFNPLGSRESTLLERAEVSWMASTSTAGRNLTVVDDLFSPNGAPPAYSVLSQGAASFADGFEIHDLQYANIDSDGEAELLALGVDPVTHMLSLRIQDAGSAPVISSLDIGVEIEWIDAEIATGDLDGDGRDEIAITGTFSSAGVPPITWLYVFDDGDALLAPLFSEIGGVNSKEQRIQMGDLDGDGDAELVVLTTDAAYDLPLATLRVFDFGEQGLILRSSLAPAQGEFEPLIPQYGSHGLSSSYGYTTLEVADFDGDGADEIVVITQDISSGGTYLATYDGLEESASSPLGLLRARWSMGVGGNSYAERYGPQHGLSFAACDASQAAGHELVGFWVNADVDNFATGVLAHIDGLVPGGPSGASDDFTLERLGFEEYDNPTGMLVCDDDGDGLDEIVLVTQSGNPGNSELRLRRFEWAEEIDPNTGVGVGELERTHLTVYSSNDFSGSVMVASGDADGDGIGLRYTGTSFLEVANPIPLVVLVAPPTKSGTTQNLEFTGASYSFSHTTGVTREVSYSLSYSSQSSGSVGSLFSGNYARAAENKYSSTLGSTRLLTEFEEYNGVSSDDYIIFHGLLVQRYVYEIVRSQDTALRGTEIVINVPVQAQQYFWTRDYYNAQVDPGAQIGNDVLGHTIGDPTSYASHGDVQALANTGTDVVWWREQGQSIPQGSGNSGHGFELGEESSSSGEFSVSSSETIGGGVELGFLKGGYSRTTTHADAHLYSITLGSATRYSATIGGISDGSEYQSWTYDWGLYVQNYSGADGRAFQILNFWTSPLGTGY